MSGYQTINDPESLRIKFTGRQILAFAIGVFAVGGYFTSLHLQVSGLRDEVVAVRKSVEDKADTIAEVQHDLRELKAQIQRAPTRLMSPKDSVN